MWKCWWKWDKGLPGSNISFEASLSIGPLQKNPKGSNLTGTELSRPKNASGLPHVCLTWAEPEVMWDTDKEEQPKASIAMAQATGHHTKAVATIAICRIATHHLFIHRYHHGYFLGHPHEHHHGHDYYHGQPSDSYHHFFNFVLSYHHC